MKEIIVSLHLRDIPIKSQWSKKLENLQKNANIADITAP
ncbi:MAG: hypothetical protein UZ05_CHB002000972 [Chlorobi bacterium OLB5]|nr:MAG: hypothetical protein UZ05_CHB002000972 [Chlorobi bacterium OLB5]